jgi:hypothetical protein
MRCVLRMVILMPFKEEIQKSGLLGSRLTSEIYLLKTGISISLAPCDGIPPALSHTVIR